MMRLAARAPCRRRPVNSTLGITTKTASPMVRRLVCLVLLAIGFRSFGSELGPVLRVGVCQPVTSLNVNSQIPESLGPVAVAADHVERHLRVKLNPSPETVVALRSPPLHGKFVATSPTQTDGWPTYHYLANQGYSGKDTFVVHVALQPGTVELIYRTAVVIGEAGAVSYCRKTFGSTSWRLS